MVLNFEKVGRLDTLLDEPTSVGDVAIPTLVAGGAGALPFAGKFRTPRVVHDPQFGTPGKAYTTLEELATQARPGDLVTMAHPSSLTEVSQPLGSNLVHTGVVIGKRRGVPILAEAGEMGDFPAGRRVRTGQMTRTGPTLAQAAKDYSVNKLVLLRPQFQSGDEQRRFLQRVAQRAAQPYSGSRQIPFFIENLLCPRVWPGRGTTSRDICSTLPAQAYAEATNRQLVPGVRPAAVSTTDLLREGTQVSPVGHYTAWLQGPPASTLRKIELLSRLGLGGVLAGTALGAYYDPLGTTGAVAGGVGLPIAARALLGRRPFPRASLLFNPPSDEVLRKITRRSLPLALLGGVGGYLGGHYLGNRLFPEESPWERLVSRFS